MLTGNRIANVLPLAAVAMVALACITHSAHAAIVTPTSATHVGATSGTHSDPTDIIDGTGLSGVGDILDQTHATASGGNWFGFDGGPDFTGDTLTFVVPTDSTVNEVHVWAFWLGTGFNWQIDSFDIEVSTNGGGSFANIGSITLDDIQATGPAGAIEVQTRTFAEQTGVDQIRFSNIGNLGGAFGGIMEVRFGEAVGVPVPAALPAGLSLLGLVAMRRNRK